MLDKLIGGLIITGITTIGSIIYGAIKTNQNNNLKQENNNTCKQNEELKKENKDITKQNEELKKELETYRNQKSKTKN